MFIGLLQGETIKFYDTPTAKHSAPILFFYDNQLVIGYDKVFMVQPGSWQVILDFGEPSIIAILRLQNIPDKLICIGYTGKIEMVTIPT